MTLTKEMNDKGQMELKSKGTTILTVINPDAEMMKDSPDDPFKAEAPATHIEIVETEEHGTVFTTAETDTEAVKEVDELAEAPAPKAKPAKKASGKKENPVYTYVTERIIAQLEAGTVPWQKGYNTVWPTNATTKKQYRGINIWLLSQYQEANGYQHNIWLTYKQARQMKGNVKKGEKSPGIVVFYKLIDKRTEAEKAEMKSLSWSSDRYKELSKKVYRVLRYTNVFNIEQTENIDPEKWNSLTPADLADHNPIESAEELLSNWENPPNLQHTGNSAFYNSRKDLISMPGLDRHEIPERYYKTRFHESVHATGHESRLNRPLGNGFGTEKYAFEELIAELGASMLCMVTGIYVEENHQNASAYIENWLNVLKDDPKFIVQASNKAQQATDNIQNINWD